MSGTTRIPVSLDHIDKFSDVNASNLNHDAQSLNILNNWFNKLIKQRSLPESSPANSPAAPVKERFNTLYIYNNQQNTNTFVGFYDFYRGKLSTFEKNVFDRLPEGEKEITLKAAVYASAASSEPVFAMQTGMNKKRPVMSIMYPKASPATEIPQEQFGLFARFLRKVLPVSMYPDSIKTEQERSIDRAEETYNSIKGDVTAAAAALADRVEVEIEDRRREEARKIELADEANKLMAAEAKRRQILGIDENAVQKGPRANFVVDHEDYAKRGTRLDVSLFANNMSSARMVQEDFPDLKFDDIKYYTFEEKGFARIRTDTELKMPDMEFDLTTNVKGGIVDNNFGLLDYGTHMQYRFGVASNNFTGAHEAGHAVSRGLTGLMWGKPLDGEQTNQSILGSMKHDVRNCASEQKFAKEAMLRAYDADQTFRDAIDKGVREWERKKGNITIKEDSSPSMKRDRAIAFMSRTIADGSKTSIRDRDDIYADLFKMGYTSEYGASKAEEFIAEAFADHYNIRETNKNLSAHQKPMRANPLSDQLVKMTQEMYSSPLARLRFAEKYGGYNLNVLRQDAQKEIEAESRKQQAQPVGVEVKLDNNGKEVQGANQQNANAKGKGQPAHGNNKVKADLNTTTNKPKLKVQ